MKLCIKLINSLFFFAFSFGCTTVPSLSPDDLRNQQRALSLASIPQLEFIIDENYLIAHTLIKGSSFGKNSKTALDFQNFAWVFNKPKYQELKLYKDKDFESLYTSTFKVNFDKYFNELKKSNAYKKLLEETIEYKNECAKEWNNNLEVSFDLMKKITKLNFNFHKPVEIYITHPAVGNGSALDEKNLKIAWGAWGHFPNYITVYLWHELLHFYMEFDDISHAVIQLATDNELRARLNRITYPPFEGHDWLNPIMQKAHPKWKEYLKSNMDLITFAHMIKDLE